MRRLVSMLLFAAGALAAEVVRPPHCELVGSGVAGVAPRRRRLEPRRPAR